MEWLMPAEHHRARHCGRVGAFLGFFALLLQALLFASHTHPLPFSAPGQPVAVSAAISGSPVSPAVADDCQICLSINHHSAVPVIAAALSVPLWLRAAVRPGAAVQSGATPSSGFPARAPPARLT